MSENQVEELDLNTSETITETTEAEPACAETEVPSEEEAGVPDKQSWRERLRPRERSPRVKWALTVILLLGAILGVHLVCQYIGTLDFSRGRFSSYFHHPAIFLMNLLPVALLMLLFTFLTNRVWLGYLISGTLLILLEFINYFKIAIRGDPLIAEDFLLLNEAAGIVGDYELSFPPMFFISIALLVIGSVVLCRYAKGKISKKLWWVRVACILGCIAMAFASWKLLYTDRTLYETQMNWYFFDGMHDAEYRASHGFFWSFLRSIDEAIPSPPENYSEKAAQAVLENFEDAVIPENERVDMVVTMLESYADLSLLEGLELSADPYTYLHELQEECYHGVLITETNGGGTVNAERSFITGGTYPHPRYNNASSSYVRYFSALGYQTDGAHPGFDWFYNRKSSNAALGFDRYLFNENFFDARVDAEHAMDEAFFGLMREVYDEETADGTPYFSFSVSYQGHSPYDSETMTGTEYVSGLTGESYNIVNNYLNSVAETGKQVSAYVDSFRDSERPVVLVFFGDHKPTLGVGNAIYEELGISVAENDPIGCYNLYSTPYFIWANDAAKEVLGETFTGEGPTVSPNYLMSVVFDACGWEGPAWMQYQRQVREILPVINRQTMFMVDGELTKTLTGETLDAYREYCIVEYYLRDHLNKYANLKGK